MMFKGKTIIGIVVVVVLFIIVYNVMWYSSTDDVTIKVTKTDRIVETSGSGKDLSVSSKYLVYTKDETFENTDSWVFGKFNSSDFQGRLITDSTYKVKVVGWRLPFFSTYRNIVKIY